MSVVYETLSEKFHRLMSDPLSLTAMEDFSQADQLPDIDTRAIEDRADSHIALSKEIEIAINGHSDLTFDQKLDLELAVDWLKSCALEQQAPIEGAPRYSVKPDAVDCFASQIPIVLDRDPRERGRVVEDLISRLNLLNRYLAQGADRLQRPVEVWTNMEVGAAEGFNEALSAIKGFAESVGYQNMPKLEAALENSGKAVQEYAGKLKSLPKRKTLEIGPEATEKLFRYKGVLIQPAEIHRLAMEYLDGLTEKLQRMRAELVKKYKLEGDPSVVKVGDFLKSEYPSPNGKVVEFAREVLKGASEFAYANGLAKHLTNSYAEIRSTPAYLRPAIPIAAVFVPGKFSTTGKRSVFYVTEFDGIEKSLNRLNTSAVTAHELIPGHHYQLSRATEHLSKIRTWVSPIDLLEGWTTRVAEQEMVGLGYVNNPELALEERYMAAVDTLRLAGRVCFVLACLTGDKSYLNNTLGVKPASPDIIDASTEVYRGITGFGENRGRADVELFSSLGGNGALYLVGNTLFWNMEKRAIEKQGDGFRRTDLFEAILKEGNMPLSYIERALEYKGVL